MTRVRLADRRHKLGKAQSAVAEAIGVAVNTYSRYERGEITPRPDRRLRLAEALGWTPEQLSVALDDLPLNGHAVPSWLTHLASLEQAAGGIATYEPVVVPALLQTADYALAVEAVAPEPLPDDTVAHTVSNRLARQHVLDRDDFHLAAVIDESVLHRIAGGPGVMASQLEHLAEVSGRPSVTLRVLPYNSGVFSAAFGAFTLLNSPGSVSPFMACTEDRSGPHYMDRPTELEAHVTLFAHLIDHSLTPSASVDLIRAAVKEHQ